jgi:hypothetical protein
LMSEAPTIFFRAPRRPSRRLSNMYYFFSTNATSRISNIPLWPSQYVVAALILSFFQYSGQSMTSVSASPPSNVRLKPHFLLIETSLAIDSLSSSVPSQSSTVVRPLQFPGAYIRAQMPAFGSCLKCRHELCPQSHKST